MAIAIRAARATHAHRSPGTQYHWEGSPPPDGNLIRDIAKSGEDAGIATLWSSDHFYQHPPFGNANDPIPESFTWLGFAAAVTDRIELGALVAGVTHRPPSLLVKQVTTLDALSDGRALFGIGAGWNETEHAGMGFPFPAVTERFERLEEALEIAKRMWSDEAEPYEGKYYSCALPVCSPGPSRKPHPPIVIGGTGKPRFLRIAAKYGAVVNLLFGDADTLPEARIALERACERIGRDPAEIEVGTFRLMMPDADLVADAEAVLNAGADHVIYGPMHESTIGLIERIGKDVVPRFGD